MKSHSKTLYDPVDELRFNNCYNIDYTPNGDDAANLAEAQHFLVTIWWQNCIWDTCLFMVVLKNSVLVKNLLIVEQKIGMISQAITIGEEGKEAAMLLIY